MNDNLKESAASSSKKFEKAIILHQRIYTPNNEAEEGRWRELKVFTKKLLITDDAVSKIRQI